MSSSSDDAQPSSWDYDPEVFLFSGGPLLELGVTEQHGFGEKVDHLFGRSREAVKENWVQVVAQMRYLLEQAEEFTDGYELSEVQFQLGFSAEGVIVFIAQAGVSATIRATFKRKEAAEPSQVPEVQSAGELSA